MDGLPITEIVNMDSASLTPEQQRTMDDVYRQLKSVARGQRFRVHGRKLDTTVLVHEAWLKFREKPDGFSDRNHFFAYCALAMRHILYNQARRNRLVTFIDDTRLADQPSQQQVVRDQSEFLIDLERQLRALREFSPRLEQVFTYRFFGDMTLDEVAGVLGVSKRTAIRDWKKAQAMLAASAR